MTPYRQLFHLHKLGQQVRLEGLDFPVTVAWCYLKREEGKPRLKRYVLSTKPLKASTMIGWGQHRWQIEGWFKTAKHRFGLHRFGQQTLVGLYRWLVLSLSAFILAHWGYLSMNTKTLPDWAETATVVLEACLSEMVVALLLQGVEQKRLLLQKQGWEVQIIRCKM